MKPNKIKSICIVGGGTAGWMAATLLNASLRGSHIQITLVESADIPSIGVGESTVPSIMDFIASCQIDVKDFIAATSASFKLGIRFDDWKHEGHQYFHPFGRVGKDVNGFDFYQVWLKSQSFDSDSSLPSLQNNAPAWLDYSPNAVMAKHQRFMLPPSEHSPIEEQQNWVLASYAHALHLDAKLVVEYLRKLSIERGVKRIEATVKRAHVDKKSFISEVELNDGRRIESDLFIDCSGFQSLLSGQAMQVAYEDWSNYLPCNRAVTVQSEQKGDALPYTISKALDAGWSWRIPLQHRVGNGYVYCDDYCSDEQAKVTLLNSIEGEPLNEPRVIPFSTGKRAKIWNNNCLALGLAAGFVEPLESTAIHLVHKTLIHFIRHFPFVDCDESEQSLCNQKIDADYHEIRDFIILHYVTAQRNDTDFWQLCKSLPLPDSLQEQLALFEKRGELSEKSSAFFTSDSWYSILEGMNIRPKTYHPLIDAFSVAGLQSTLQDNIRSINNSVMRMPSHQVFIDALVQSVGHSK